MADHDINYRNQQTMMMKHWLGICKFILERVTAIIPKMDHFYLGGAQDSYRILSVHIEKLMHSVNGGMQLFPRPSDSTTSKKTDKLLESLKDNLIPPVEKPAPPEKKYTEYLYETKENLVQKNVIWVDRTYDEKTGELISHEIVPERCSSQLYVSDKKYEWLHDTLIKHRAKYGNDSNPATVGRTGKDTVGLTAVQQPDYYMDPADFYGYEAWTGEYKPGGYGKKDDYCGLYTYGEHIIDPGFVGSTRYYSHITCFHDPDKMWWSGRYKNISFEDGNNWRTFYTQLRTIDNQNSGTNGCGWSFKPGWAFSQGFTRGDTVVPARPGAEYTRYFFDANLGETAPAVFKNVDVGMLLHESPVDPDVYVFGYSYYKSMVRTLIYNCKGLKVSCTFQYGPNSGTYSSAGTGSLARGDCAPGDDSMPSGYRSDYDSWPDYFNGALQINAQKNCINVTADKYVALAPGKWITGDTDFIFRNKTFDMGYRYYWSSDYWKGSPGWKIWGNWNKMKTCRFNVTCHADLWKTFKAQVELNRYYYPLYQIYRRIDSSYRNRFLRVFGESDQNLVDLWQYRKQSYDHDPYAITTLLDNKKIYPLYIEVISQTTFPDGTFGDNEVNIHFSGAQETWFTPYYTWTFSVATLIKNILDIMISHMSLAATTDMDVFNMYQKLVTYISFFKQYSDTIVRLFSVAPFGGENMDASIASLRSGNNPGPAPMAKRIKSYRIKNKRGKRLHEFLAPNTQGSDS